MPVLKNEAIEGLSIKPDGTYVDGTFGGGGHAREIISRLNGNGCFVGIDQDEDAVENGRTILAQMEKKTESVSLARDNFSNIKAVLTALRIACADGILLDIGVSSHQLDQADRGFSYMQEAPLDMRMDQSRPLTARDIVNTYPEEDLFRIIRDYGEEKWASRIAHFVVQERKRHPIETTTQLVSVIKDAIPASARRSGPHPAKRTFQALRIEVNDELGVLERSISDMVDVLSPGGRLVIITFQSLEDRIVKQSFKTLENPCICPPQAPVCTCGRRPKIKIITRKPIVPSDEEIQANPRSRSAKLRICEKLPETIFSTARRKL